jgi:2-haloacid dehalogenase
LTAAGTSQPFAVLAEGALRTVLHGVDLNRDPDAAVEHVLSGFDGLPVHADVPEGVRALRAGGHRLVTLSNGSAGVAQRLLESAGLREEFDRLLSVEDAGVWKPAPGSYGYAARACGASPREMMLVAVHPWDIDGAARAGMRTAWINRTGGPYPNYCRPPDHAVSVLGELAERLTDH